jgi:hypothetical protein
MIAILNDGKTLSFPQSIPPLKEEEEDEEEEKNCDEENEMRRWVR